MGVTFKVFFFEKKESLWLAYQKNLRHWTLPQSRSTEMLCFGLPIYIYINSTLGKTYGIKCGAIGNQWERQNQYGLSPMALVEACK